MLNKEIRKILTKDLNRDITIPHTGDVVKVHQKIEEKGKERIQIFKGLVISVKNPGSPETMFTVRKESNTGNVERIFPLYSPFIEKIETVSKFHTRKSKMYFIKSYNKRLKETKRVSRQTDKQSKVKKKKSIKKSK